MSKHNSFLVRHAQIVKESSLQGVKESVAIGGGVLSILASGLAVAKGIGEMPNAQKANLAIAQLSTKAFNEFRDTPKKKIQEAILTVVQAMPNCANKTAVSVMYTYVKSILSYGSPSVDLIKSMTEVDSKRQGFW